jgi:hypothetical protein
MAYERLLNILYIAFLIYGEMLGKALIFWSSSLRICT